MKRFKFSLKAIATLRELEQMRALNELSKASRTRQQAEDEEKKKNDEVEDVYQSTVNERRKEFTAESQVTAFAILHEELARLTECQHKTRENREREIQRLRQWQQCKLQVNLYEKIKDTERRRHWQSTFSAEQKELDDMINQRRKPGNSYESE